MTQVSSLGALPEPSAHTRAVSIRGHVSNRSKSPPADDVDTSASQTHLSRLSSVLNSLQSNAATTRTHYLQVADKVRSGTYQVDAQSVSRSIVDESVNG